MLLHGLEQTGLGPRHGPVDFVNEHDIGQNGSRTELEFGVLLIEELNSHHIRRQEVRRTLDSLKRAVQGSGCRFGKKGFPHTGDILNESVAFTEKGDEDEVDGSLFTYHDGGYVGSKAVRFFLDSIHSLSFGILFLIH
ncbi:MAG: hypothetical protein H6Q48_2834 [Deltaproteobacteria bacterium]|nr:hypothetical protein [Deltaproteobacteria bacterium]